MIQAKRALERAFPDRVVQVARPFCTNRPQTFVCLVGVVCPTDSGRQRRQGRRIFPATARTSSEHTETTRSGVRGASGTRAEPTGLFVRWSRLASELLANLGGMNAPTQADRLSVPRRVVQNDPATYTERNELYRSSDLYRLYGSSDLYRTVVA